MQKLTIICGLSFSQSSCNIYSLRCCIDAPKGASYYPQNVMLRFYICYYKNYYVTIILLEKLCFIKTNINFRNQVWNRTPAKCWVKDFILPHKYSYSKFLPKILSYFSKLKMEKRTIILWAII